MRALKLLLLILPILIFIGFGKAQYLLPIFENITYSPWYNLQNAPSSLDFAIHTSYINETYLLLFSRGSVYRYDKYGVLQALNSYSVSYTSMFPMRYLYLTPEYIFTYWLQSPSALYFNIFNTTAYALGGNAFYTSPAFPITGAERLDYGLGFVYPGFGGAVHISPIFYTKSGSNIIIYYDWFDFGNLTFTISDLKSLVVTNLNFADFSRVWVYSPSGYCRVYDNCVFQIIYEGSSISNNNRYGIYLREYRRGFFGWEYMDVPLISCTAWSDCMNFPICYSGKITNIWIMPETPYIFYIRIEENPGPNDISYAYLAYNYTWFPIGERRVNVGNIIYKSPRIYKGLSPVYVYYDGGWYFYQVNVTNVTLIPSLTVRAWTQFSYSIVSWSTTGYYYFRFVFTDYYNSSNTVSCQTPFQYWESRPTTVSGDCSVTLPNASIYNISITLVIYSISATSLSAIAEFDMIFPTDNSRFVYDYTKELPIFLTFGTGLSNFKGVQYPIEYCFCTEWVTGGCVGLGLREQIRACQPSGCAQEVRYIHDDTCVAPTNATTTTTTIPSVTPIVNITGMAEQYNITGPALTSLQIVSTLITPAGITLMISILVATAVAYFFRGTPHTVMIWLAVFLGMIVIFALGGWFPKWVMIMLIMISALAFAYLAKGGL